MQNLQFFQGLERKIYSQLRDYQLEGVQEIDKHVENGETSILRQAFTGTGKSVEQFYLAIKHLAENPKNIVLFLAHKEELVENLAKYFLENKIYISFIQSGKATLYNSRVYIASVDTLKNRLDKIPLKPTLILADECFPAGTKVDGKPIEDYKIGDLVNSWNEETGEISKKRVTHVFKSNSKSLVKVKFTNGLEIISTSSHPFYVVNKGWINADKLKQDDELFSLSKSHDYDKIKNEQILSRSKSFLQQDLFKKRPINKSWISRKSGLFSMQKTCGFRQKSNVELQKFWTCLLFNVLYKIGKIGNKLFNNVRKNGVRFFKNITTWLENGIYTAYRFERSRISNALQNRYCKSKLEDSNRNRWHESLRFRTSEKRFKENKLFEIFRLESVEIFKSDGVDEFTKSSGSNTTVYNLEVEDYHTYFAEGVLVHNCHHSPAKSWKKILNYYDCTKIGFSATPTRLDGASFTDIFKVLVNGRDYKWYIDNGYLAPFQFVNPDHFVDFEFKIVRGDYDLQQQSEILDDEVIYADAVETWHKFTRGLKTVTFCSSILNSQKTAIAYNNYGFKEFGRQIAEHLDGTTDKKYRKEILKRFRLPLEHPESILVICNFNLINEGVDIPDCGVTQWLRKTASEIFYDQGNGRSNRIDKSNPGKIQYIIDHVGNKLVHGYPDRVRTYDLKGKKEKEAERKFHLICGICQTLVHKDYRKLQKIADWIDCPNCECTVPIPKAGKSRGVRKEKETDTSVEMVLDTCIDRDLINLQVLFNKYNTFNNKRFFDQLIKFDHITLEHLKLACQFRNVDQSFAYSSWSRKLAKVLN